jgi:hypothetical protein
MIHPASRPPKLIAAALTVLAASIVAGCGGSDESVSTATVTSTATVETTASTTSEATTSTGTNTGGAPPPADQQVTELTPFTSPSGNIGCYIDQKSVRCDIKKRDWDPPARPASCNENVDYGQGIELRAGGSPGFVCAGDSALAGGDPLPYGQSIAAGLLRCESEESGMSCRDTESGRGFTLSIQAYKLF